MNKFKFKLIIVNLVIYYYQFRILNNSNFNKPNDYLINERQVYLKEFLTLKENFLQNNESFNSNERENIIRLLTGKNYKNLTTIKRIIFETKGQFGNIMIILNKLIYCCEAINCNHILLPRNRFWFIKNPIFLKDSNITIEPIDENKINITYKNESLNLDTLEYKSFYIFYVFTQVRPKIKINLFKEEIIKNLPVFNISRNDLYIHVRSGDIFSYCVNKNYAQPPLCFYKSILQNFNFTNIYLISKDRNNPLIDKLLVKFKNIIYLPNNLESDLSHLINSYNLVASISSFLIVIIILNSNLENLYEYNIYKMKPKILHFHYDLYKYQNNFTIYRMEPSKIYMNKMYVWKNNKIQRKLMIKEKCINSFKIIRNSN